MIDFPDTPTIGDVFESWTWNGEAWTVTPTTTASSGASTSPLLTLPRVGVDQVSNLWARYRADDVAGSDGSPVSTWSDLSGNTRDLTAASGKEPTLKVGQLNGRRALRFPSGTIMTYTPGSALALPWTVFIVANIPRTVGYRYLLGSPLSLRHHTNGNAVLGPSGGDLGAGEAMAVWCVQANSTEAKTWRNGQPLATRAGSLGNISTLNVGGAIAGTFEGLEGGDVYEVAVYNAALTEQDRASVERELCAYYGILHTPRGVPPTLTTTTVGGQNVAYWTPVDFVAGRAHPLLLISHGGAQSHTVAYDQETIRLVDVALQMGFVVAASNEGSGGSWRPGSTDALADCDALIAHIEANVCDVERIVCMGVSYGGQSSLHNLRRLSTCVGWIGIAAVCDSTTGPTSPASVSNPLTDATSSWTGKRMLAFGSSGDSTVSPSSHSIPMIARGVSGNAAEATYVACTGAHIDPSHYQATPVAAFLWRCLRMELS